eukprot:TRINITY_DN1953_c0_g1_i1.p1 TRINITY_DN1953_c0_g1~~TRINITY_DN1953_c0_g1_i1.p1  ORF type:complete len:590 (+),score=69.05 TRINITY_DN1953_c0_g1_i1:1793-3562(+)
MDSGVCKTCTVRAGCPAGNYLKACSATADSECVPCTDNNCATCAGDTCSFCKANFFLHSQTGDCTACSNPTCASGAYETECTSTDDAGCTECTDKECSTCEHDTCTVCKSGFYLDSGSGECTACTIRAGCSAGQYLKACSASADSECVPCTDNNCTTCPGDTCATCKANFFLDGQSGSCSECSVITECDSTGYYVVPCSPNNNTFCDACADTNCVTCPGNTCTQCEDEFYVDNSDACQVCSKPDCKDGEYLIECSQNADAYCDECTDDNCKTCPGNECIECYETFHLDGLCTACDTPSCTSGEYLSNCTTLSNSECKECTSPCTECISAEECIVCPPGYALQQGVCIDIQECIEAPGGCGPNSLCNTPELNARTCECLPGFEFLSQPKLPIVGLTAWNPKHDCVEIEEGPCRMRAGPAYGCGNTLYDDKPVHCVDAKESRICRCPKNFKVGPSGISILLEIGDEFPGCQDDPVSRVVNLISESHSELEELLEGLDGVTDIIIELKDGNVFSIVVSIPDEYDRDEVITHIENFIENWVHDELQKVDYVDIRIPIVTSKNQNEVEAELMVSFSPLLTAPFLLVLVLISFLL